MPPGKCFRFPFLVLWVVCKLGGRRHILSVSKWTDSLPPFTLVLDALGSRWPTALPPEWREGKEGKRWKQDCLPLCPTSAAPPPRLRGSPESESSVRCWPKRRLSLSKRNNISCGVCVFFRCNICLLPSVTSLGQSCAYWPGYVNRTWLKNI